MVHRDDVLCFRTKIYLFFHLENSHKRLIYHHVKVVKGIRKFTVHQRNSLEAAHNVCESLCVTHIYIHILAMCEFSWLFVSATVK